MVGDDSEWVKNVRAARGVAFIKRGRTHPVVLTEIPREKRAPILKAWSQVATSGRKHLPVTHHAPVSALIDRSGLPGLSHRSIRVTARSMSAFDGRHFGLTVL